MDKPTRNLISNVTQAARRLLEGELAQQLEGVYDILPNGMVAEDGGSHLGPTEGLVRDKIAAVLAHKRAGGKSPAEAVDDYLREAAFTCLNRFVALKMLEARELVRECVSRGDASSGFREFCGLASGLASLPDKGYRLYVESLFDELSTEIKVLFDRHDPASLLWPRRQALVDLLAILNAPELSGIWVEDETIGWVYQYFNSGDERKKMREESQAPRSSHELAVRNQFFTPRYVVQFLTDNTLGRIWFEMRRGDTALSEKCAYLVRSSEDVPERPKKDPRDIKLLDPAGGSGHFLLYAFDLFLTIYEEAWQDQAGPKSKGAGNTLCEDYPDLSALRRALPALILEHNLHAVDIDPRCVQIAALALWMRAQRAYKDFGVPVSERASIRRINVVVAEPMPGDEGMVDDFAARLEPPLLGTLFKKMVGEMRLAGELGTLLRVEDGIAAELRLAREQFVAREELLRTGYLPGMEPPLRQGELDLSGIDDSEFFHQGEARIAAALRRFAEAAMGGARMRRQLFADDAAEGVAFIDLLQHRFDVALMNPPFGLATPHVQQRLASTYLGAHNDVFAAFLRRARELTPGGLVGAITSRSFLVAKRLEQYRRTDILPHLHLLADLGNSVMDEAFVESAAFVLTARPSEVVAFSDVRSWAPDEKPDALAALVEGSDVLVRRRSEFLNMPQARILYDLPEGLLGLVSEGPRFEPTAGTAREGMKSFDNFRFVRLWWEVPSGKIGEGHSWLWLAKGGSHAFFAPDVHLVLNWSKDGAELRQVNLSLNGTTAQVRQASGYWYRAGATYSRRSARGFSARALPAGCVFTDKGPAVLPEPTTTPTYLLGWLNSRPMRALIHLQANASDFLTGILKSLPWKPPAREGRDEVEAAVSEALSAGLALAARDETSPCFAGVLRGDFLDVVAVWSEQVVFTRTAIDEAMRRSDKRVSALYRIDSLSWADDILRDEIEVLSDEEEEDSQADSEDVEAAVFQSMVSFAVGVALGRWSGSEVKLAANAEVVFEAQPSRPPAAGTTSTQAEIILSDDPGGSSDVSRACQASLVDILMTDVDGVTRLCEGHTQYARLRDYLQRAFFDHHLAKYSKSRRKAPIYWQLATPSASYSVWLYLHCATKDSLFQVLNDLVTPKMVHEERLHTAMTQGSGGSPTGSQRKEIAEQETFVDELHAFREEVARVAPLWNPNLNDGVIINFAPLWRLVPHHKAWQKECKACWDKLVAGDYDWAHLAMHLWPERVVPKCASDRSLAIAHGLEDVFWEEDDSGKWQPNRVRQARVAELVQERTSPAVKAALQSLLDAPSVASGRGPRAPRRQTVAQPAARPARPAPQPAEAARVARGPAASDETLRAVRDAIAASPGGASRAEVMASTDVSATEWNAAISALLERGEVVRTGEKRGTRYFVKGGLSA